MRFLHLVRSCQQGEARPPTHFCRSSFPLCQTEPGGDRGERLSPRSYAACGRHLALCPQGTSGLRKAGPSPPRTDRRCPRSWALARPPSSPEPRVSAPAPGEQHSLREAVPSSPEASAYGSCHIVPALSWNRHRGLCKCVRTSSIVVYFSSIKKGQKGLQMDRATGHGNTYGESCVCPGFVRCPPCLKRFTWAGSVNRNRLYGKYCDCPQTEQREDAWDRRCQLRLQCDRKSTPIARSDPSTSKAI